MSERRSSSHAQLENAMSERARESGSERGVWMTGKGFCEVGLRAG